jgi:hypothetical protein
MWKVMCSVWLGIVLLGSLSLRANEPNWGENTVLVYLSKSGEEESQFVIRMGRFVPDRVFEWESLTHQGVVHLHKKAVLNARQVTLSGLFDIGSYIESDKVITKWLSDWMYSQLSEKGEFKSKLNRISAMFVLTGEETYTMSVNKNEVSVPALRVEDSRRGSWLFHADRDNPVLLEYRSDYYRERLARVSTTGKATLRWLKRMPAVK